MIKQIYVTLKWYRKSNTCSSLYHFNLPFRFVPTCCLCAGKNIQSPMIGGVF